MSTNNSETRVRILNTTVQMLEKHGGRGVRMADIAKQAGISRQAVYLHFKSRVELLDATTKFLDDELGLDGRLTPSRTARSGAERLALYVEFWGSYVPEIYGVSKALLLVLDTDEAAAAAWRHRMSAHHDGCRAAIEALHAEGNLATHWTRDSATDVLWTMLSVTNWEQLTMECGWSNQQYIDRMKTIAESTLLKR